MSDMYDIAVRYWVKRRKWDRVRGWRAPRLYRYGYLFTFLSADGTGGYPFCGCPVQQRKGIGVSEVPIPGDVPSSSQGLTPAALRAIAECQRNADRVYPNRVECIKKQWDVRS